MYVVPAKKKEGSCCDYDQLDCMLQSYKFVTKPFLAVACCHQWSDLVVIWQTLAAINYLSSFTIVCHYLYLFCLFVFVLFDF